MREAPADVQMEVYSEAAKSGLYAKPSGLVGKYDNVRRCEHGLQISRVARLIFNNDVVVQRTRVEKRIQRRHVRDGNRRL